MKNLFFLLIIAILTSCTTRAIVIHPDGTTTEVVATNGENVINAANAVVATETGQFAPDQDSPNTRTYVNVQQNQQQSRQQNVLAWNLKKVGTIMIYGQTKSYGRKQYADGSTVWILFLSSSERKQFDSENELKKFASQHR